jgi:hypothetical protein
MRNEDGHAPPHTLLLTMPWGCGPFCKLSRALLIPKSDYACAVWTSFEFQLHNGKARLPSHCTSRSLVLARCRNEGIFFCFLEGEGLDQLASISTNQTCAHILFLCSSFGFACIPSICVIVPHKIYIAWLTTTTFKVCDRWDGERPKCVYGSRETKVASHDLDLEAGFLARSVATCCFLI